MNSHLCRPPRSGDLGALSREVRGLLDGAGLRRVQIMASGGLDETAIERLVSGGAPIDSFGIGTSMGVSADAPGLDIAYKLTEYGGKGRLKLSAGKPILPGRKQVFRRKEGGRLAGDEIARSSEQRQGVPLLSCVMRNGRKLAHAAEPLPAMRERARDGLARLPKSIVSLAPAEPPYPVAISAALASYDLQVRREIARKQQTEAG
jgi:nicotinate phosphoribosyltransferase